MNVVIAHTMLGQPKTLNYVFCNIKVVRAQDIHLADYPSSWFTVKNMSMFLTRFTDRKKCKVGRDVSVKL